MLKGKHVEGPVVSSSSERPACYALYVADVLNQPCLNIQSRYWGDYSPVTVLKFLNSEAKIIFIDRNDPLVREMTDSRFRDLDLDLFGDPQTAAKSEIKVFELLH